MVRARMRAVTRSLCLATLTIGGLCSAVAAAAATPPPAAEHPNLRVGGFSDFGFQATDQESTGATSGFRSGQFVLHFTSTLAARFGFFGEVSVTAHATEFSTEIERSILKFQANDYLSLSFGRYHTPINWWNAAFHHGQWLQTSIDRPEMTRFGGAFIPVHFVGAVAQGVAPLTGFDLSYEAGVGNGRAASIARDGDAGDVNNNRAWFGTLAIQPNALYPLQVGGGFYRDLVSQADGRSYRENIAAVHAVWTRETPEVLAEGAFVGHRDRGTAMSFENWAYYVQLGYRFPWSNAHFKPYGRVEQLRIDDDDAVFSSTVDVQEYTGGVRWDVSDFVALKSEYRRQDFKRGSDVTALLLQASFAF